MDEDPKPFVFNGELELEIEGQHTSTTTAVTYLESQGKYVIEEDTNPSVFYMESKIEIRRGYKNI